MDALSRADEVLARARARRADVVTPDSAISPMDTSATVQIPRATVSAADPNSADPESTLVLPRVSDGFGPPLH